MPRRSAADDRAGWRQRGGRAQVGIGDEQFLKSMIPHHAGAILMCQQASLEDPEIRSLCDQIIESQEREIGIMQAKLQGRAGD